LHGQGLRCVAQSHDGSIWFGVQNGVVRYDGIHWTTYSSKDGLYGMPVNDLVATPDGSVYAGTPEGMSRFYNGIWHRVFPEKGKLSINRLSVASDGSVWAGTALGALHLAKNKIELYTTTETAVQAVDLEVERIIIPEGIMAGEGRETG